jgi:predicted ArsR family transcriptional regulator
MDTSTRILKYLMRNQSATAADLSRELDLTKADIHHHLRKLLNTGEIEVDALNISPGAGRPARRFKRVQTPPLKLTRLVVSVLLEEQAFNSDPYSRASVLAERIARDILSCCPSTGNFISSHTVRLNHLVEELKSFGIDIRWEARKNGPQLFFDYEALSLLIDDATLVGQIINRLVNQIQKETA